MFCTRGDSMFRLFVNGLEKDYWRCRVKDPCISFIPYGPTHKHNQGGDVEWKTLAFLWFHMVQLTSIIKEAIVRLCWTLLSDMLIHHSLVEHSNECCYTADEFWTICRRWSASGRRCMEQKWTTPLNPPIVHGTAGNCRPYSHFTLQVPQVVMLIHHALVERSQVPSGNVDVPKLDVIFYAELSWCYFLQK